jgi:hypothetical protein
MVSKAPLAFNFAPGSYDDGPVIGVGVLPTASIEGYVDAVFVGGSHCG